MEKMKQNELLQSACHRAARSFSWKERPKPRPVADCYDPKSGQFFRVVEGGKREYLTDASEIEQARGMFAAIFGNVFHLAESGNL